MKREKRPLVTDEPVEFEINLDEVQDFRRFTNHFGGIYGIYLKLINKTPKDHNMQPVWTWKHLDPMIGENRQLVTDELVEFELEPVEVQDFRRITDHFRGIHGIYLKFI